MAGRASEAFTEAMAMVLSGESPYKAAIRAGIALSSMYRNQLYRAWRDGELTDDQVRSRLDSLRKHYRNLQANPAFKLIRR